MYFDSTVNAMMDGKQREIEILDKRIKQLEEQLGHERERAEKAIDAMLSAHGFASVRAEKPGSNGSGKPEEVQTILKGLNKLGAYTEPK